MTISVRLFESFLLKTKRFGRRGSSGTDLKKSSSCFLKTSLVQLLVFLRLIGNTLNSLGPFCERDPFQRFRFDLGPTDLGLHLRPVPFSSSLKAVQF